MRAATLKGVYVSDLPTETEVMIIDNCEKALDGWSLAEVAVTIPWAIVSPPHSAPCFIARFCCCSLAHLSV